MHPTWIELQSGSTPDLSLIMVCKHNYNKDQHADQYSSRLMSRYNNVETRHMVHYRGGALRWLAAK